jgi:hypothetical protein
MRLRTAPRTAPRALRPELALTTVGWIAALALLALNDHVLKQGGALPGWLTGKLSDFAGLYVAPALLATVLRTRSWRALALCHLAVGAGFAAINLDPSCAAWCVRALARVGIHWRIVADAGDLIALPSVLASYHWLGAAMERDGAIEQLKRRAQQALAVAGLACCLATSNDWDESISSAGPHLHNPTGHQVIVLVRPLRGSVALDCDAVAKDPGRMIPDSAFAPAVGFVLDPHENVGAPRSEGGGLGIANECGAMLVSGTRLAPVMMFWRTEQIRTDGIPTSYKHKEDWLSGAIVLQPGHEGVGGYISVGGPFVFPIAHRPNDAAESCELPSPAQRPAITMDTMLGTHQLWDVDEGADGCVALRLGPPLDRPSAEVPGGDDFDGGVAESDAGSEPDPGLPADSSDVPATYVCLPHGMFPFERGDIVTVELTTSGLRAVRDTSRGGPFVELDLSILRASTLAAHLDISVSPREDCEYRIRPGCAETAIATQIEVRTGKQHLTLHGGEPPQHVNVNGFDVEFAIPFAQQRAVVDSQCAEALAGQLPGTGLDAALVAVVRMEAP